MQLQVEGNVVTALEDLPQMTDDSDESNEKFGVGPPTVRGKFVKRRGGFK
jgi:hypothetical protein